MEPLLLRLAVVTVVLAVAGVVGLWWRHRDGRIRTASGGARLDGRQLRAVGLHVPAAGVGAVLVGSATCAPCDQVKRVLATLAEERRGFGWVYADVAEHLELARTHAIMRVPTLLVVDASGRVLTRSSGVPRVDELRRVVDDGVTRSVA